MNKLYALLLVLTISTSMMFATGSEDEISSTDFVETGTGSGR